MVGDWQKKMDNDCEKTYSPRFANVSDGRTMNTAKYLSSLWGRLGFTAYADTSEILILKTSAMFRRTLLT
jgi:hypothetical protein